MIEYTIAVSLSIGFIGGFLLGRFLKLPDPEVKPDGTKIKVVKDGLIFADVDVRIVAAWLMMSGKFKGPNPPYVIEVHNAAGVELVPVEIEEESDAEV